MVCVFSYHLWDQIWVYIKQNMYKQFEILRHFLHARGIPQIRIFALMKFLSFSWKRLQSTFIQKSIFVVSECFLILRKTFCCLSSEEDSTSNKIPSGSASYFLLLISVSLQSRLGYLFIILFWGNWLLELSLPRIFCYTSQNSTALFMRWWARGLFYIYSYLWYTSSCYHFCLL